MLFPQEVADKQNSIWPSAGSSVVQLMVAVYEVILITDIAESVGAVVSLTTFIGADSNLLLPAPSIACMP